MKLQHRQKGFSLYSLSFYLGLLAFVVFTGLKLFPVYMESFSVESSVRSMEGDRGQAYTGALSVRSALAKRLRFNNVEEVTADDITVIRQDDMYIIDVDYEIRIPYIKNIELIVSFSHHGEVLAR